MTLDRVGAFWEWFDMTRGDLSVRQIEKQANCPRGRIGNAYSVRRALTKPVLEAIADGLGLSQNEVFEQAGWLSPSLDELRSTDPDLDRACRTVVQLPQTERSIVFRIIAALARDRMDLTAARDLRQFMEGIHDLTDDDLAELQEQIRALRERGRDEDAQTGVEYGET